ncbi:MAG TPA: ribosome biogenesis GTP-binding protein YihA/YsxC [Clostridia bacterium]|nr:ribosome biogenesis GTP-binding protein YihA/YsxC [Clostridia bacterium]MDD3093467.1 ribosome biogenesis GTP-binding protein YihA/YsxC [Clostridia bacterium]HPJ75991.1 ribosome biogenesis GTP-binding protein YihA/YsxC [Clostridia bacterium]
MIVKSSNFIISAVGKDQWPDDNLPEVVFSGKSNVGKSSLINALCNRKNLAYSGSTPGKTRMINFYDINGELRFVDLPGYGYSKASKQIAKGYSNLADDYFKERKNLRLIIQILDIRHDPTDDDIQMIHFLNKSEMPFVLVIGKCDKLSKAQSITRARKIAKMLIIDPDTPFILTSAITKRGIEEIWDVIEYYCFYEEEAEKERQKE